MAVRRWRPLSIMAVMSETMRRLMEEPSVSLGTVPGEMALPGIDLYEQDTDFVLEAAVPGVAPDQIDLSVTGNCVVLKGEVPCEISEREQVTALRHERPCGAFEETISLPEDVDATKAQATYADGILRVMLPKAAVVRARRIEVQAGEQKHPVSEAPAQQPT